MSGTVVVSLDFELGWGHRLARPTYVKTLREHESHINQRFARLTKLFDDHDIPATWAVVGKLLEDGEDALFHCPDLLLRLVKADTGHDVGLHSYSHRPFDNLSREEARADISSSMELLSTYDIEPVSFVFPQNRIAHLNVLAEHGIECYRDGTQGKMLIRLIGRILPTVVEPTAEPSGLVNLPGSMFLAANRPLRVLRWQAAAGLRRAQTTGGILHFWLHPHNVIAQPALLDVLKRVFSRIGEYRQGGELEVKTMAEIAAAPRDLHSE